MSVQAFSGDPVVLAGGGIEYHSKAIGQRAGCLAVRRHRVSWGRWWGTQTVTEGRLKGWRRWTNTAPRTRTDATMRDFSCDLVMKLDEGSLDMVNGALVVIGLGRDVLQ